MASTFLHSGCLGDLLYALPTIQAFQAGDLKLCDRPWTKPLLGRQHSVTPLLRVQPCIASISEYHGEPVDHDLSTFRSQGLKYGDTVIERQARWVHAKVDVTKPWLISTTADTRSEGKIVVNRCPRWPGFHFPWRDLVHIFGPDMLFVGLASEHKEFCKEFGEIKYAPTSNLLEVSALISGAELFIGNQSCPLAIAEGLHKRTIVECCCFAMDCVHRRPGNIHCVDGGMSFEALGKYFESPSRSGDGSEIEIELMDRARQFRDG